MSQNEYEKLMKEEILVAACGCGGVCSACRRTLEKIEALSEAEQADYLAFLEAQ